MEKPDLFHFFSWASRVSLELPVGFEEMSEDQHERRVLYRDDPEDDERLPVVFSVQVAEISGADSKARAKLADALEALPGRTRLQRTEGTLEGLPAVFLTASHEQPDLGRLLMRREAVVQAPDRLFTLSGACGAEVAAAWGPAFEHAFRTARFILPTEGRFTRDAGDVTSIAHEQLLLSLHAPAGFEAKQTSPDTLRVEKGDTWLTFTPSRPDGYGEAWLRSYAKKSLHPGMLDTGEYTSLRALLAVTRGTKEERAWLSAAVQPDRYRLIRIEGRGPDAALLESVVRSPRLLSRV